MDFHLFDHINADMLELRSYDPTTSMELEPAFLCKSLIYHRIEAEVARKREEKKQSMDAVRSRSNRLLTPHKELDEEMGAQLQHEAAGEYVMSHVQPIVDEATGLLKIHIKQWQCKCVYFLL